MADDKTTTEVINNVQYPDGLERDNAAETPSAGRPKSIFMEFIDLLASGLVTGRERGADAKKQTGMRPSPTSTSTNRKV